jgi:hypothetical protein
MPGSDVRSMPADVLLPGIDVAMDVRAFHGFRPSISVCRPIEFAVGIFGEPWRYQRLLDKDVRYCVFVER